MKGLRLGQWLVLEETTAVGRNKRWICQCLGCLEHYRVYEAHLKNYKRPLLGCRACVRTSNPKNRGCQYCGSRYQNRATCSTCYYRKRRNGLCDRCDFPKYFDGNCLCDPVDQLVRESEELGLYDLPADLPGGACQPTSGDPQLPDTQ